MMKTAGHLPVKTRLPLAAWLAAGLITFASWISHTNQILDPGHRLASMGQLFPVF
jgi:hypothetical protein